MDCRGGIRAAFITGVGLSRPGMQVHLGRWATWLASQLVSPTSFEQSIQIVLHVGIVFLTRMLSLELICCARNGCMAVSL